MKILLDGDPCTIVENEFVKPGKGQAFNRVRIRNLRTGRVIERTFKSGDTLEAADVVDVDMQFLYADGQFWHFMQPESTTMPWLATSSCTRTFEVQTAVQWPHPEQASVTRMRPGASRSAAPKMAP